MYVKKNSVFVLEIATKRRRGRQKEEGEEAERHTFAYYTIYKGKKIDLFEWE